MENWVVDPKWPAGMRVNNPGNLKYSPDVQWQGSQGPSAHTDQGTPQVTFDTPTHGFRAMGKLIVNKYNKGMVTPMELIAGQEGWTPGYTPAAENIAMTLGVGVNDKLDISTPDNLKKVMKAIVTQEHGGSGSLYPDEFYDAGIQMINNETPQNNGSVAAPAQAGPVTTGTDAGKSYNHYKETGINTMPNAANGGKPQVNVYGHVNWTRVDPHVKDYLGVASARLGFPINITSGFRDLNHPSEAKKGPHALHRHTSGKAIDIDIGGYSDEQKQQLLETLVSMGANGVGIYPGGKMLHMDWTGLGSGFKGKGTASTWNWDKANGEPAWYTNGMARGLQFAKEGKFPEGIALDANFPSGTYASMPQGQQQADMSYGAGVFPDQSSDETNYIRAQNDRSINSLDLDGTSYADTIGAAFSKSWILNNAAASAAIMNNAPDPNYSLEKDLPRLSEGIPQEYADQFSGVTSAAQGDLVRKYIAEQMKRDALINDNPNMGMGATILAEIMDPVALTASWATEGLAAPVLYGAKVGRIARALGIGFTAGVGNMAAEGALDAVDPRQHTITDYGMAMGAGMFIGTGLGYFAKGNGAVDAAVREEIAGLGNGILADNKVRVLNESSAGAQAVGSTTTPENILANDGQFDFEDMIGAETADVGRKIGNAIKNPLSDPITKAEAIGPEAFVAARSIIPDPRGARAGEVVEQTVVDRHVAMVKAGMYDWETTAFAQYKKWAKRNKTGAMATAKRIFSLDDTEANEFFKKVTDYVEETDPLKKAGYDPEIKAVGDKKAGLYSTLRREGEARRIAGMPTEDNPNYTPFYRDDDSISLIQEKYGHMELQRVVDNAVERKFNEASPALRQAISEGWLKNITRASLSAQDGVQRVFAKGDRTELIAFLRDELGVKDQTMIDEFMQMNIIRQITQEGKEVSPRVKSRTFDLEGYQTKTFLKYRADYKGKRNAKGGEEVSLRDFFQKNAHAQMSRYIRDMSGVYAFADLKVYNPKTGDLVIDGVRDDADWMKFKKWFRDSSLARDPGLGDKVKDLEAELEHVYQEIRHAGGTNPRMSKIARRMMTYSFVHFMQNMGINQAQEFTNIVSGMGIRAAIQGIPAYRRMLDAAGKSVPTDPVMRDLQSLLGRGDNVFMGARRHYLTEEVLGNESASSKAGKAYDKYSGKISAVVTKISGMEYVDNYLQNWAMRSAAQYFANLASEYGSKIAKGSFKMTDLDNLMIKDSKRLRALGLDDTRLIGILNQFRKHSGVTDAKTKLSELNMDKWDANVRNDFRLALDRWSSRAIQHNDIGSMSRYLTHPVSKFIMQFRSFIFGAFGKQSMYGINHFDMRTVSTWLLQTMAGAGTWYLFNKTLSMGEKNPDQFMEKKLGKDGTWEWYRNLGTAGLNRSGWTSIFPMLYDTSSAFTGAPNLQGRLSGQATAAWGSPLVSLFDQTAQASRAAIDSFSTGREQSRQEVKNNARVMTGNWLPLMAFLGHLTQDRPETSPIK